MLKLPKGFSHCHTKRVGRQAGHPSFCMTTLDCKSLLPAELNSSVHPTFGMTKTRIFRPALA